MGILDYLRLGSAQIKAHKKRTLTVVMIVGLLFSVIMTGAFLIQGIQNAALGIMLAPTDSKVLVMSGVDPKVCDDECNPSDEIAAIKNLVEKYGGRIIPATITQNSDGVFYHLSEDVFTYLADTEDNVTTLAVSPYDLTKLLDKDITNQTPDDRMSAEEINELREQALHQVVTSKTGQKYYIADILPGGIGASSLSLSSVDQSNNPLDLILSQINTGLGVSFIIDVADGDADSEPGNSSSHERPSGVAEQKNVDIETIGFVFAEFPSLKTAYNYYRDEANYCSEFNRFTGNCGRHYQYQTIATISDPIITYDNLQTIWQIFKIIAAVLAIIALVIAVATYVRIIDKDIKVSSLYRVMGATSSQVRLVYLTYLFLLSVLAIMFAVLVGLILAIILSLVNQAALQEVFTLGFGVAPAYIWLVGWNSIFWYLVISLVLAAILALVLCHGQFQGKKLAKTLR